jgi:hypothetical protein
LYVDVNQAGAAGCPGFVVAVTAMAGFVLGLGRDEMGLRH